MAGRCISATHVAFSSIKIMKTGGQTGRATGIAAMLCKKRGTTPRGVARRHMAEFHNVLAGRGQYRDALKPKSRGSRGNTP